MYKNGSDQSLINSMLLDYMKHLIFYKREKWIVIFICVTYSFFDFVFYKEIDIRMKLWTALVQKPYKCDLQSPGSRRQAVSWLESVIC